MKEMMNNTNSRSTDQITRGFMVVEGGGGNPAMPSTVDWGPSYMFPSSVACIGPSIRVHVE